MKHGKAGGRVHDGAVPGAPGSQEDVPNNAGGRERRRPAESKGTSRSPKPVDRVRERMSQGKILRVTMTRARSIRELPTIGYGRCKGHAGGRGQGSGPRGRRRLRTGAHARESSGFKQFSRIALR